MADSPLVDDHGNPINYTGPTKAFADQKVNINWYKDPKRINYVGAIQPPRPGVLLFSTLLEYTFFPPDKPEKSRLFSISFFKWGDVAPGFTMVWSVITIPKEFEQHAKVCADKAGMRIADGVPTMLGGSKRIEKFIIDSPNTWTLENEKGHPVYKNLGSMEMFLKYETQICSILQGGDIEEAERQIKEMRGDKT